MRNRFTNSKNINCITFASFSYERYNFAILDSSNPINKILDNIHLSK